MVAAHIIHETLATKDVGEEARGILNVRTTFGVDHLLPILVIHCPKVLLITIQHQLRLVCTQIGADALNLRAHGRPRWFNARGKRHDTYGMRQEERHT